MVVNDNVVIKMVVLLLSIIGAIMMQHSDNNDGGAVVVVMAHRHHKIFSSSKQQKQDVGIGAPIDLVPPPPSLNLLEICEGGLASTGKYPGAYVVGFVQCAGCPPPYNWFLRCPRGIEGGQQYDMASASNGGGGGPYVPWLEALSTPDTPGFVWTTDSRRNQMRGTARNGGAQVAEETGEWNANAFDYRAYANTLWRLFGMVWTDGGVPVQLRRRRYL
ncbi:hypothetical protein PPROV_000772000 [Pycnococcus provasolii]|uniref:Uncharacterized protein n=2 Tax=Pycnococcus provasolii TaxID=41880 RepID=A0A830HQH3_9CHLO|nr:hypothetical protein PPROV_000772000 [Pycnococcus provasolii]|mmetsp:Transcript_1775/g.4750  ORF Transcript_1775/g.4750 Transcript_1775/m.4750 type:complete len:218 (+) Transcript_1775:240-893(+)